MMRIRPSMILSAVLGLIPSANLSQAPQLSIPANYDVAPAVASVNGEPSDGLEMGAYASKNLAIENGVSYAASLTSSPRA